MAETKRKRTLEEVRADIAAAHQRQHELASELLNSIKARRADLENCLSWFQNEEPDLVYRFYHQSFKVFILTSLIDRANNLFYELSPTSDDLNPWFCQLVESALSKKFDDETNAKWLEETLPILQAFWHCKYFLEQNTRCRGRVNRSSRDTPKRLGGRALFVQSSLCQILIVTAIPTLPHAVLFSLFLTL